MKRHLILLVCFLFIRQIPANGQNTNTLRVLFVGNSYTYFWNLPQTVQAMAQAKGISMVARKSTAGGTSWKQHWNGEKDLKTREKIEKGNWDIVILQNHSMSAIDEYEDFMTYGKKFIDLVKSKGATPLLYETWARKNNPMMQKDISKAYKHLASANKINLVPVGQVWAKVKELRPDLDLYVEDGSHPSIAGTYLTACMFFQELTGKQTAGLPERVKISDKDGELLFLSIMDEITANFLQNVVDDFYKTSDSVSR